MSSKYTALSDSPVSPLSAGFSPVSANDIGEAQHERIRNVKKVSSTLRQNIGKDANNRSKFSADYPLVMRGRLSPAVFDNRISILNNEMQELNIRQRELYLFGLAVPSFVGVCLMSVYVFVNSHFKDSPKAGHHLFFQCSIAAFVVLAICTVVAVWAHIASGNERDRIQELVEMFNAEDNRHGIHWNYDDYEIAIQLVHPRPVSQPPSPIQDSDHPQSEHDYVGESIKAVHQTSRWVRKGYELLHIHFDDDSYPEALGGKLSRVEYQSRMNRLNDICMQHAIRINHLVAVAFAHIVTFVVASTPMAFLVPGLLVVFGAGSYWYLHLRRTRNLKRALTDEYAIWNKSDYVYGMEWKVRQDSSARNLCVEVELMHEGYQVKKTAEVAAL